jgi:hypothetical protein
MDEQNHIILMTRTYASGAQEWYCPTCGRRFIVQWTPEYQRVVLEAGDESAIHNTGKGAFIVRCPDQDDEWLEPWNDWIKKNNIEKLWNESQDLSDPQL